MPELCSSNMILNLHSRAGPKGKDWKMATNQHQKSLQMWEESPFNQRPPHVIGMFLTWPMQFLLF